MPDSSTWAYAKSLLQNAPNGKKIARTHAADGTVRPKHAARIAAGEPAIHQSFVKLDNAVFCIAEKRGQGTFGSVRMLQEQDKAPNDVVKSMRRLHNDLEPRLMAAKGYSRGNFVNPDNHKTLMHMTDLGENLESFLKRKVSEEDRFRIAIDLALSLHKTHHGLDTEPSIPAALLDIKPTNITVDKTGRPHFVDYGFADEHPFATHHNPARIGWYGPPGTQRLSKEEHDVIALKRVFFLPQRCVDAIGVLDLREYPSACTDRSLLTPSMMQQGHLDAWINTADTHCPDIDAFKARHLPSLTLAALLVSTRKQLGIEPQTLRDNVWMCHLLALMHQKGMHRRGMLEVLGHPENFLRQCLHPVGKNAPLLSLQALFVCQQMGINPDRTLIAKSKNISYLLQTPGMAPHLPAILKDKLLFTALLRRNQTVHQAVLALLKHVPDSCRAWRDKRIAWFLAHPELAASISAEREAALATIWKHRLPVRKAELAEHPEYVPLLNRLESAGLASHFRYIAQWPEFCRYLIADQCPPENMLELKQIFGTQDPSKLASDFAMLRENPALHATLWRRGFDKTVARGLHPAQQSLVIACDHREFNDEHYLYYLIGILARPNPERILRVIQYLDRVTPNNVHLWIRKTDSFPRPEAGNITLACADFLATNEAGADTVETVFRCLCAHPENLVALRAIQRLLFAGLPILHAATASGEFPELATCIMTRTEDEFDAFANVLQHEHLENTLPDLITHPDIVQSILMDGGTRRLALIAVRDILNVVQDPVERKKRLRELDRECMAGTVGFGSPTLCHL